MLVKVASSKALVGSASGAVSLITGPIEVGQHNYLNFTVNIRELVHLHGSPTSVTLFVGPLGSNDGVNWFGLPVPPVSSTAEGVKYAEGLLPTPFLAFEIVLTVVGSTGDEAEVVFCLQANLVRKLKSGTQQAPGLRKVAPGSHNNGDQR